MAPGNMTGPIVLFDSTFYVRIKHGLEAIEPDHKAAVILGARQLLHRLP